MSRIQDFLGVLRGAQIVLQESVKVQSANLNVIWTNSSVKSAIEEIGKKSQTNLKNTQVKSANDFYKGVVETAERVNAVVTGIRHFASNASSLAVTSVTANKPVKQGGNTSR